MSKRNNPYRYIKLTQRQDKAHYEMATTIAKMTGLTPTNAVKGSLEFMVEYLLNKRKEVLDGKSEGGSSENTGGGLADIGDSTAQCDVSEAES